jgi:RHS repeat-associated protein
MGGWQVLTEYNGSGVFQQWYAYGNYIDEVIMMGTTASPTSARFYIHDHLYSPAALTTWTGTILERYEYDAYGSPTIWNADFTAERDSSNYGNPYLFTGRRVDILDSGSLKIQYNRNRYYDYYTGRWLTNDPINYVDSMNLYEYCANQPFMGADPLGLLRTPIVRPFPRPRIIIPTPSPIPDISIPIPIPAPIRRITERLEKEAAYQVMLAYLRGTGWEASLDHWFHEIDPDPLKVQDPEDPRIKDLKENVALDLLIEAWVAKNFCNMKVKDSKWYSVADVNVYFEFSYPRPHPAGGMAPYDRPGFIYLGSWGAELDVKKKENCLLDIEVTVWDKKHWKSFCKTFKALGLLLSGEWGVWCDYQDHARDAGPYSPSQGGDCDHHYIFDLKGIPIRSSPCTLCK